MTYTNIHNLIKTLRVITIPFHWRMMGGCFLFLFLLSSCGEDSRHFKIEGRLLQMNQGEFYVYSTDGGTHGIDTIKVQGGRFAFETPCERPTTLTLVFPNFSEIPIFAEPGKTVKINGDASHLKKLEIKGTKTNELMSSFREQIANASPPETKHQASRFITDHPQSPVGLWIVRKYFICTPTPDYKEALRLIKFMSAQQKDNGQMLALSHSISALNDCSVGSKLPTFTAYDTNGKLVSSSDLSSGIAVICAWASWSYSSTDMLRQLKNALKDKSGVKVVAISVDASKRDCENNIRMSQIEWPVVCTGEMFETKLLSQLGMLTVPDNIVIKNGKIIARDLSAKDLADKVK